MTDFAGIVQMQRQHGIIYIRKETKNEKEAHD